jgi:DNA adenine methylase
MSAVLNDELKPTRPVLRYHGGKWKLAADILTHFPPHRVYVEPFGGGASILLRKPRSYAEVYNEKDGELVNLFRVVRDRGDELKRALELTPFARNEYRLSFEVSKDPVEQARRSLVRSFMGFGSNAFCRDIKSGFRANSNRSGTTPARDWRNYPSALEALIDRLRGVVIENKEAAEVIRQHDGPRTLHYCDPPYPHSTRSTQMHGHHGYPHEMTDDEHRELAGELKRCAGMVVVSGYACALYDEELFPDWHRVEIKALADGARPRVEVLWINAAAQKAKAAVTPQASLFEVAQPSEPV